MPRMRIAVIALALLAGSCSNSASSAPAGVQEQYLQVARTAGERVDIRISDADWLRIGDIVCSRDLQTDTDYQELLDEIDDGAPDPGRAQVMRDVARTAITLFCPP
ncbi:MAG: DUF732 domain-containing protein [Acidimicrobiia bacterium]|nr:DUF732 domain-containing protein [Acidimicrobiia bacterium]